MTKFPHLAAALILAPASGFGAVVYDEGSSGDLPGTPGAPASLAFDLGANTIIGQTGLNGDTGASNNGVNDADYFSFTIGAGSALTSIIVDSYTFPQGDPGSSFIGQTEGVGFTGQGNDDIDGFVLFNAASGEIIDDIGGSLGLGTYSIWIQETSANVVDYQFTFTQATVPEPSSGLFGLISLGLLALHRRR